MIYTAIATVRDRNGTPVAVRVPDHVHVGDVVQFRVGNIPSLGLVHHLLSMDEYGVLEEAIAFLQHELPDAECVWHPADE